MLKIVFKQKSTIPRMSKIVPQALVDNQWEQLGVFYLDERSVKPTGIMTVIAYDSMLKADKIWVPDQSLEFPMSMDDAVDIIAELMGITVDPRTQVSHTYTIDFAETSEINTLIFDIGKVLVDYDWKKLLQDLKYDEETSQSVAKAVFLSDTWTEGDRGVLSEEELLQAFISNNPVYEKEIRETFQRMGETIHVYSYTKSWLKYLKKQGYKLYILSNFSQPLYHRCQKEMKFLGFMDGGYMSWQIHCLKPEPEIYQKLIKDFQIEPSKAVFIDDRLDNVAEARAQGLYAVHFTGRKNAMGQLADFGVK